MSDKSQRPGRQEMVLVVEDDPTLRLGLTKTLRSEGFRVEVAKDGREGTDKALKELPDLVLLDVMLPEKNGFEVCEDIRAIDPDVPIIFLTAKGEEEDKVRGLKLGADDYMVKPFGVAELIARVDAALRRSRRKERELAVLEIGETRVDFKSHSVTRRGESLEITALEMKLLRFLSKHEGELVSRQRILDGVWGADYFGTDRTVDNFITRLRQKLEDDPKNPRHIVTVRGAGYRFSRSGGDAL
jgi:two-component system alkaline phosphatase synthesis response regulator PhoP